MNKEYLIKKYTNLILSKENKENTVQEVIEELNSIDIKVEEKYIILDRIADIFEGRMHCLFEQQNYDYIEMMRSASERLKKLEVSAKSNK